MSRRSIGFAIAAAAILALCVAWEVASPWWTLKSMRDAAQARDGERLASYVDFPRARTGLRDQLIEAAGKRVPVAAIQAIVGKHGVDRIIDPAIKTLVSPQALRVALDVAPQGNGSGAGAKNQCGMKRESLNRFRVRCAQLPIGKGDLMFEREGFGWRLVGIDLPDDYGAAVS